MSLSHSGTPHEHDSAIHHAASPVEHIDTLSDSSHGIPVHGRGPAGVTTLVFECTTSPIPRLHELADNDVYDIAAAEQTSTAKISHEEFHILIKYSLPVFGYVLPLTFPPFRLFSIFFLKYSACRILFHPSFGYIHRPCLHTGLGGCHLGLNDGFCHWIQYCEGFCVFTRYPSSTCLDLS